jgi:hypothetical protein
VTRSPSTLASPIRRPCLSTTTGRRTRHSMPFASSLRRSYTGTSHCALYDVPVENVVCSMTCREYGRYPCSYQTGIDRKGRRLKLLLDSMDSPAFRSAVLLRPSSCLSFQLPAASLRSSSSSFFRAPAIPYQSWNGIFGDSQRANSDCHPQTGAILSATFAARFAELAQGKE